MQLGDEVDLLPYHPALSLWSGIQAQVKRAISKSKSAISQELSKAQYEHIQQCNLLQVVNNRLSDANLSAQANLDLSRTAVCIEPTAGSEFDEEWNSRCSQILQHVLSTLIEASVEIPEDVAVKVFPVILANARHPNVSITLSEDQHHVLIVGRQQDADKLKSTVESIIQNNLDTVEDIPLPLSILVFTDQCIRQTLEKDHPQIIFQVSLPKGRMQVSGKAASCERFLTEIQKLQPVTMKPLLPIEALRLFSMPNGKQFLHSKLPYGEAVSCYYTAQDGTIPSDDITPMEDLHIVGPTLQKVQSVVDTLQKCFVVIDLTVPCEFENTYRMEPWSAMKRSVENEHVAVLTPVIEKHHIQLVCDVNDVDEIKQRIVSFIERECYAEDCIPVERGQWQYMCMHYSDEWNRERVKIEDAGIEYSFPQMNDQVFTFRLKGETTPVRRYSAVIKNIIRTIVKERIEVAKPGAAEHFLSEKGRLELTGVGTQWKAFVDISTLEVEEKEAELMEQVAQPLHRRVCSGVIAGDKSVDVMVGDLTEYSVDVIVNAANPQLQHGGGLAGLISRKGGDIIQKESTQYIAIHGPLDVGQAVLMKRVGNLRCKAVVHAVGPKWENGRKNEEAYLARAVERSLLEAQEYTSIGLPAISSGIYGVPLDVSARAMFTGISTFFQKNPQCNIKVTIMLYKDSEAEPFDKVVDQFLQNVLRPKRSASAVLTATSKQDQVPEELAVLRKAPPSDSGPRRPVLPQTQMSNAILLRQGLLADQAVS